VYPDGTAGGFSVELLDAAAHAAGLDVTFKVGQWSEIKEELARGELDVLPLVSYSKERDKIYDFTAPYLRMNGTVFVRKGSNHISTLSDLKGKDVLVMQGDTAHEYVIRENLTDSIITTPTFEEAFSLLAAGKHDAIVVQQIVGLQIIKKLGLTNIVAVEQKQIYSLKPIAMKLEGFEQKFCFAVVEGNHDLLSRLNEGLAVLYLDGTYNSLYEKWFAPILPQPEVPTRELIKQSLQLLIPILFLMALVGLWFLKRLVVQRTHYLREEIQQRELIEEKLADANAKYIKAQQMGKVGNWEYDIATHKFQVSSETILIFGFGNDTSSLTVERVEKCIPEKERVHQALVDLIDKNIPYNIEYDIITEDGGELKTVNSVGELQKDESGNAVTIQGVILDITQRKKSETDLRKSEERYRELFEDAPFPYQSLDETGCILEVNRRWLEHLGYSRDEVVGRSFGDFLHPDWQDHFRENFPRFKSVGEILGVEFQLRKKDGTYIWVSFDGKIKRDLDGLFIQTHCIFIDISEQKRLQNKVDQQHEALNQSQKLESVGRLAGGVAHDFNNMLSIILGYTELALGKLEPSDPLYGDMKEIYQAGVRSADLTRQLLAFARKQTVAPKVVNLNDNIGSMTKMLRHLIGEDIDLVWMPGTELWSVKIDPSQIDQILANLCVNARDAITDIGNVTIETKNIVVDKESCAGHAEFHPGEYVLFAVSDDGCGIAPEVKAHIFEPFFTTKELGKGTGLGLATVYGIVKQNNGFIYVYTEPEKGTTVKVYLPRYAEQTVKDRNETEQELPQSLGETILLVEDDASILKLTRRILEKLGYKVLSTTRSKDAKKIAEEYDGQINLLLTDVVMPEMNGRELSEQLQNLYPQLKTLFMSGYTANVIVHRGVLDEGIHFVSKPFSPKEIAIKMRDVLD
jgi:PAS domain S-box-containing protein